METVDIVQDPEPVAELHETPADAPAPGDATAREDPADAPATHEAGQARALQEPGSAPAEQDPEAQAAKAQHPQRPLQHTFEGALAASPNGASPTGRGGWLGAGSPSARHCRHHHHTET